MNIGLIGTGLMGLPMAQRLLEAGHTLMVYNRNASKLEPLKQAGATIAPTAADLIRESTAIVLMLTNAEAIRETLFPSALTGTLTGKTVIQMSTIAPTESRSLRNQVIAAGGEYLEAPVLGSTPEAKAGKLIIMVGSTIAQFEQWRPVLECFGPEPTRIGEVGTAAAVKLALNQLIGSLTAAFATSLSFVQQQGVETEPFMQILRNSALYAPTFDKKLQRLSDRDFDNPNFPTKHLLKDTKLFLSEAESLGINGVLVAAVQSILEKTIEQGLSESDYSALIAGIDAG